MRRLLGPAIVLGSLAVLAAAAADALLNGDSGAPASTRVTSTREAGGPLVVPPGQAPPCGLDQLRLLVVVRGGDPAVGVRHLQGATCRLLTRIALTAEGSGGRNLLADLTREVRRPSLNGLIPAETSVVAPPISGPSLCFESGKANLVFTAQLWDQVVKRTLRCPSDPEDPLGR